MFFCVIILLVDGKRSYRSMRAAAIFDLIDFGESRPIEIHELVSYNNQIYNYFIIIFL